MKNEISTSLQFSNSPTRIFETYGMSETLSHIALKQISPIQEDYFTIFNDVEISVLRFDNEDVVTASGGLLDVGTGEDGEFNFDDLFGNN